MCVYGAPLGQYAACVSEKVGIGLCCCVPPDIGLILDRYSSKMHFHVIALHLTIIIIGHTHGLISH